MEAGITTLGVTLSYGVEDTAGTKPATFIKLNRINDISEVTVEPERIDASALEDTETRYKSGRATVSDTMAVTVNKTNETVAEWETLISAYQALTGGKKMWFQTITPGITKAEFIKAAPPTKLPITAKEQNSLNTMVINLTVEEFVGLDTAVTPT